MMSKTGKLIIATGLFVCLVGLSVLRPPVFEQEAAALGGRYVAQGSRGHEIGICFQPSEAITAYLSFHIFGIGAPPTCP